ncbi:unnamed protein product [Ranitomeya imitator]|uniref:Aminotransferase class I/classII large domain-containing protein n=1 Tax=Ranitomeya imitator TaxID=111125 RepID=A0ABN9KV41_9NEOB|nr:unnamed protein product [Ranitomeya imitator]
MKLLHTTPETQQQLRSPGHDGVPVKRLKLPVVQVSVPGQGETGGSCRKLQAAGTSPLTALEERLTDLTWRRGLSVASGLDGPYQTCAWCPGLWPANYSKPDSSPYTSHIRTPIATQDAAVGSSDAEDPNSSGYTTGPKPLIDLLRQRSRPYLFSNTLPPAVVGSASKALDLLMESNEIAQSMAAKTTRFRTKMTAAGFTISGKDHPICPVMLGDARLASSMADEMLDREFVT